MFKNKLNGKQSKINILDNNEQIDVYDFLKDIIYADIKTSYVPLSYNPEMLELFVEKKAFLDILRRKDFSFDIDSLFNRMQLLGSRIRHIEYFDLENNAEVFYLSR